MHYRFHVNVFARPAAAVPGPAAELGGATLPTVCAVDGRPLTFDAFLACTFEEALAALVQLHRLDAEPDGFFVLAGVAGPTHWRVSGQLFDFGGRLHRVELNGDCPSDSFDDLLACFGAPPVDLTFELIEQGVTLDEAAFRAWASRGVPAPGA